MPWDGSNRLFAFSMMFLIFGKYAVIVARGFIVLLINSPK